MLQQILQDMFIDPEVLDALNEDQKKTLFVKMRQEQVRRWTEREEKLESDAVDGERKRTTAKKANSKNVSWELGRDGDVAVTVIRELDELNSKFIHSGFGEKKAQSLQNNAGDQTILKSRTTEPVKAERENTQPGISLNLKGKREEASPVLPLPVSVSEHSSPAAAEKPEPKSASGTEDGSASWRPIAARLLSTPNPVDARAASAVASANPRICLANLKKASAAPASAAPASAAPSPAAPSPSLRGITKTDSAAPASTAPASTAPASTAPASTAPAPATPASVAPASAAPFPSSRGITKTAPATPAPAAPASAVPASAVPASAAPATAAPASAAPFPSSRGIAKTDSAPAGPTSRGPQKSPAYPSGKDVAASEAPRRPVPVGGGPSGGAPTCAGRGRVAQLMKTFSTESSGGGGGAQTQPTAPRSLKPPLPNKPGHLRLKTTPTVR